ncbi:MAG: adenosylmethionine decarboxylase [Candidatus Desulfofervidaceae bacterium]|nr:adenosylmethionine decarboxylase [Candidatus Desulfofervidaceae bacterium]
MKNTTYGFGQHLMLDGYGCNKDKLMDIELLYNFLDAYPDEMEMTKVMPPYVFRCEGKKPEDWGYSGFVIIAESHISIHTFPEKNYLSLDIFSCKTFDAQKAIDYVVKLFEIKEKEIKLIDRGIEFPHNIVQTAEIVNMDRQAVSR